MFPERGGHDSHYQAVSLMALTNLYLYTSESGHRQALYPALLAGYEWEATRISASGHIDDTGNTRTAHDLAVSPENKRINPREVALTLVYLSHLGPAFSEPHDLGEAVLSDFARQSGD